MYNEIATPVSTAVRPADAFPAPGSTEAEAFSALSREQRLKFHDFGWGAWVQPRFSTISAAILRQIDGQPDAVAVEDQGQAFTYRELDTLSNRLVYLMRQKGVRKGEAVCIYLQRSWEMVAAIVAAMKLGVAYVPQHVGVAPAETLDYIANLTGAKVVLTLSRLAGQIPGNSRRSPIAVDQVAAMTDFPQSAPVRAGEHVTPDSVAMVLFTSGTTGIPNGVRITHRNLANILLTAPGDLGMRPGVKVGQVLSIAFDMAAWETLGALANGATLVIRGRSIQETAEKVDILIATPSVLNSLDPARCQNVRTVAVAGEPCPRPLADTWSRFCRFYNSCGPTETTIINTAAQHHPDKEVLSIGRPTPNNTVYILDEHLKALPIGEKGEMWAGGDCVTAGYLANAKLTAERYRPDPFRPGHFMFRTRDLGRWTADGELEHFGRVDDMVKIRGFRVELDGVSAALEASSCCEQAVTLKFDDRNLVSFISPAAANPEAALQQLENRLPYYCKPALVVPMQELPRTPRGKIDKRKLLKMAAEHISANQVELNR